MGGNMCDAILATPKTVNTNSEKLENILFGTHSRRKTAFLNFSMVVGFRALNLCVCVLFFVLFLVHWYERRC